MMLNGKKLQKAGGCYSMSDTRCPFCGSEKIIIAPQVAKGYTAVELKRNGKYEPKEAYCCNSQRKNAQYLQKRYGRDQSKWPDKDPSSL